MNPIEKQILEDAEAIRLLKIEVTALKARVRDLELSNFELCYLNDFPSQLSDDVQEYLKIKVI